jgi:hypothetical protein
MLDFNFVDGNNGIRTYDRTIGATYTIIRISHHSIRVSLAVHFIGKGKSVGGAICDTYPTTFAFFCVNHNSAFKCHIYDNY